MGLFGFSVFCCISTGKIIGKQNTMSKHKCICCSKQNVTSVTTAECIHYYLKEILININNSLHLCVHTGEKLSSKHFQ